MWQAGHGKPPPSALAVCWWRRPSERLWQQHRVCRFSFVVDIHGSTAFLSSFRCSDTTTGEAPQRRLVVESGVSPLVVSLGALYFVGYIRARFDPIVCWICGPRLWRTWGCVKRYSLGVCYLRRSEGRRSTEEYSDNLHRLQRTRSEPATRLALGACLCAMCTLVPSAGNVS